MERTCALFSSCKEERGLVFKKNEFQILECTKCNHRFLEIQDHENHVQVVYSDDYFFAGQHGYPNYLEEKYILYKTGLWYAKLISKYSKPGRVLDVGCAAGFILKGFQDSAWECRGVEPNDTMAEYGRRELKLDIVTGSLENFETKEKFSLVSLIQVVGHFYNIDAALEKISQILASDGLVLVESWNMKSSVAKLLGKHWHEYSPPSVVHWFSDRTLTQLFSFHGFELVAKGLPRKRIGLSHALSLFKEKTPGFIFKEWVFNFLDRSIGKTTVIYPPFDVKWYIFQRKKN